MDDVLLYFSEIDTSIPCLFECLQQFGRVLGFRVNLSYQKQKPYPLVL